MNAVAQRTRSALTTLTRSDAYRLVYVVLAITAVVFGVSVTASHSLALSPFDEWMYLDYLVKFPTQGYLHLGEPIGDFSMNWMACHGLQAFGSTVSPDLCGAGSFDRAAFPFGGIQTAQLYTPLYFAPTWTIAAAIQAVTGISLLEAARFTGTIWLVATVLAIAALLRMYRVPATATIAVGLLFLATPFVWWTYTFVSTDVTGVLVGTVVVIAIERVARGRLNAWWIVPLFTVALLLKSVNAVSIGIVFVYAIVRTLSSAERRAAWRDQTAWAAAVRGRGPISLITGPLVATVVALTAQLLWLRVVAASAVGAPAEFGEGRPMLWHDLVTQIWTFVPSVFLTGVNEIGAVNRWLYPLVAIGAGLGWLCLAGVIGLVWSRTVTGTRSVAAKTALLASIFAGPALAVMFTLSVGEYTDLGARYGANLVGLFLLTIALLFRGTIQRRILLGLGIVLVIYVLLGTIIVVH
ncbi:hypothetical protein ACL9RL_02185 [Plantibacter sp. Mn2098]|uniref:hypothetical protein n=1 Tax=Plantibacter sp. Mn2098 TaxID=3395266 RepID=UPI003BC26320